MKYSFSFLFFVFEMLCAYHPQDDSDVPIEQKTISHPIEDESMIAIVAQNKSSATTNIETFTCDGKQISSTVFPNFSDQLSNFYPYKHSIYCTSKPMDRNTTVTHVFDMSLPPTHIAVADPFTVVSYAQNEDVNTSSVVGLSEDAQMIQYKKEGSTFIAVEHQTPQCIEELFQKYHAPHKKLKQFFYREHFYSAIIQTSTGINMRYFEDIRAQKANVITLKSLGVAATNGNILCNTVDIKTATIFHICYKINMSSDKNTKDQLGKSPPTKTLLNRVNSILVASDDSIYAVSEKTVLCKQQVLYRSKKPYNEFNIISIENLKNDPDLHLAQGPNGTVLLIGKTQLMILKENSVIKCIFPQKGYEFCTATTIQKAINNLLALSLYKILKTKALSDITLTFH